MLTVTKTTYAPLSVEYLSDDTTIAMSIHLNTGNISKYLNLDMDNPANTCPVALYLRTRIKESYSVAVRYGYIRLQIDNPNTVVYSIEMPNKLRDWISDFDRKVFSTRISRQLLVDSVLSLDVEIQVPTETLLVA